MHDRLVILFPLAFLLIGGLLLFLGLRARRLARASQQWPSAPGRVTRSHVDVSQGRDSNDLETSTYTARVEYEYAVGGCTYRGDRVRFGLGSSQDQGLILGLVDCYPVDAVVDVFYDPERPGRCTLDRTAASGTLLVALGAVFVVVSFLLGGLVWALR